MTIKVEKSGDGYFVRVTVGERGYCARVKNKVELAKWLATRAFNPIP